MTGWRLAETFAVEPRAGHRWPERRSGSGGQDGLASVELAILFPAVLFLIMAMFQFSLYWHTANAAELAAEEGVNAGQVITTDEGASEAAATQAALAMLEATTRARNALITADTCPRPTCAEATIEVVVETDAPRLVGLGTWRVRSVAQGRLEEFVPADER